MEEVEEEAEEEDVVVDEVEVVVAAANEAGHAVDHAGKNEVKREKELKIDFFLHFSEWHKMQRRMPMRR